MLDTCDEHGVAPIVTFHHFTVPRWLHEQGGIASEKFPALFERYCDRAAQALGDRIAYACRINEPQGLGSSGWLLGVNPPGHTDDRDGAQRAVDNLLEAHRRGAAAIRSHAGVPAGVTLAIPDIQYEDGAQPGSSSLELESRINDWFLQLASQDDFIGVQTYTRFRYGPEGARSPGHDWSDTTRELAETDQTTQMGYEYYPRALGGAIGRHDQRAARRAGRGTPPRCRGSHVAWRGAGAAAMVEPFALHRMWLEPPVEANAGLAAVLRGLIADFQHASGAEIVSVFLYDESTHTYYAPFATGQPQESLLDSLTDMREQLARYLNDERQGKAPDELGVHQYGSTGWLTVTRQRLVARDAPAEIDSTFIRPYQVRSKIGLPLLAGERFLGLVYLNYRSKERAPDDNKLRELERRAGTA